MSASIIEFKHAYPSTSIQFTQNAAVGDVIVVNPSGGGAAAFSASDNLGNVYTVQTTGANITCLTAPVTVAGVPKITVAGSGQSDIGVSGWIVRGLSSATANKAGYASGLGNPLTVSLSPTVECALFVGWNNEGADVWTSFTESCVITPNGNHDTGHYDANGYNLSLAAGTHAPGMNGTSNSGNRIAAVFLPITVGNRRRRLLIAGVA